MDIMRIGPMGGNGGKPFDRYNIPGESRMTAVHIYADWVINALQLEYAHNEKPEAGIISRMGGSGGERHVFQLDEDEYLTGISGRVGWYVDSLRLHTNKRVSPRYGGEGGDRDFTFVAPPGYEIFGLFGRADWYIDALGIVIRPRLERDEEFTDEDELWLSPVDEGEPVPVRVVVRREVIDSPAELDELEDAALAEAIADLSEEEGTADAAVYTQVLDDVDSRGPVAVVMAVAGEAGAIEDIGDESGEVAVMVTNAIETDDDLAMLEEEAVEAAVELFLEQAGEDHEEVIVTVFSGETEDEDTGRTYGAAVALVMDPVVRRSARSGEAVIVVDDHEPRPKDLQKVEGIGPKIAELLIDNGVYDLVDLASTPVERLIEILEAGGKRFRLADPTTWPDQAKLGATGAWDELAELQSRLKGGTLMD